ncbi:MAG: PHP domain-containing protein, partial [Bacteroidota bacterium]|nr:PHP domain-containing protein [Bacteroidota bacterium]
MRKYKADLHIHTVLSPCGSLEMSPQAIVMAAKTKGLSIIGITDHNHTGQCEVVKSLAAEHDIFVLCGAEITTKEEAHCLTFFETQQQYKKFQKIIDDKIIKTKNNPDIFGYQIIVDKKENIIQQIDHLLISATTLSVEELSDIVYEMNGIFIPAHVNRQNNSLISQLGFIPFDLKFDALEISRHTTKRAFIKANSYLKDKIFITSSDAHFQNDI